MTPQEGILNAGLMSKVALDKTINEVLNTDVVRKLVTDSILDAIENPTNDDIGLAKIDEFNYLLLMDDSIRSNPAAPADSLREFLETQKDSINEYMDQLKEEGKWPFNK